jgi:hypothetical protein
LQLSGKNVVKFSEEDSIPVEFPHFPNRLFTYVWRNWSLIPVDKLAKVVNATVEDIVKLGQTIGLQKPPDISSEQLRRSYITIIRRNWHLLPDEQIIELLGWTREKYLFILQEDDFLWNKLGRLKPDCSKLLYKNPDPKSIVHAQWISEILKEEFPIGFTEQKEKLFHFIQELSDIPDNIISWNSNFTPRYCYSYFALYGDPLIEEDIDPFPDGYLARLASSGVDGVWLQGVLTKLAPFPWDMSLSDGYLQRIENLKKLVARAKQYGIKVFIYLNEPRSLPVSFFEKFPDLRGVTLSLYKEDRSTLCTSHPDVQNYLQEALASIVKEVPDIGGFFTITASENLTNCWSFYNKAKESFKGSPCPRCSKRTPAEVIAEVNALFLKGIKKGFSESDESSGKIPELIVWDWSWSTEWNEDLINKLPPEVSLMSVSERGMSIERGGVKTKTWDYTMSVIGPGPVAKKVWEYGRKRKLKIMAKIQANNTWEISSVPYIPVLDNVAKHVANLRDEQIKGLMLSWTLGGYPSPNLEVVAAMGSNASITPDQTMEKVAKRRYGIAGQAVVEAWKRFSNSFNECPFGRVYQIPTQFGPANLLWSENTGYSATMVGIPYDDADNWSYPYGLEIFASQLIKVADGFDSALENLRDNTINLKLSDKERIELESEIRIAEAIGIHFRSAANQTLFVKGRRNLEESLNNKDRHIQLDILENILLQEIKLAKRMNELQRVDSRLGYEATNHYYYVPLDLVEKVINCRDLLDHWLVAERKG